MNIECKKCPYRTRITCKGQGEYYAECMLIKTAENILAKILNESIYDIKLKNNSSWAEAITEESTCILFEVEE